MFFCCSHECSSTVAMNVLLLWIVSASLICPDVTFSLICLESASRQERGPFLYNTSMTDETLNANSCIISNNSAAIGGRDLGPTYGIVCHRPNSMHSAWYNPDGDELNGTTRVSVSSTDVNSQLRRRGNFDTTVVSGIYECLISNQSNTTQQSLFVGLYRAQQQLSNVTLDITAREGKLMLNCSSAGLPATTVNWFFRDQQLNNSIGVFTQFIADRLDTVYHSILTLSKEELQSNSLLHNGKYECQVMANLTSLNASTNFTIVPTTPRAYHDMESTVSWVVDPSTLNVLLYELKFEGGHCNSSGSYDTSNTSVTETELGLEQGSNYTLSVRAVNAFTSSEWSQPIQLQTTNAPPTGVPENVTAKQTSTAILLAWNEVNCYERNSLISYYFISYAHTDEAVTYYINATGFEEMITGLTPATLYRVSIAAVNEDQVTGPALNFTVTTDSIGTSSNVTFVTFDSETSTNEMSTTGSEPKFPLNMVIYIACGGAGGLFIVSCLLICCCCCCCIRTSCSRGTNRHKQLGQDENDANGYIMDAVDLRRHAKNNEPIIHNFPRDLEVCEGEYVILYVCVSGNPPPVLTWYHNDESVNTDPSIEIMGDGTLSIPSMEEKHVGLYRLVASNPHGSCFEELQLGIEREETFTLRRVESIASMIDNSPVPVASFEEYMGLQHSKNNEPFQFQFFCLNTYTDMTTVIASMPENKTYNRFKNILPYDDNRVILKPEGDEYQNDYINASYLDGYTPSKYIATQGPLPHTVVDFWRMVWQERTERIIMLCGIVELHRVKCQQYWPEKDQQSYGPITVKKLHQENLSSHIIRKFKVSRGSSETSFEVTHYQFMDWPDHSVPESAGELLSFLNKAAPTEDNMPDNDVPKGPIIVHCSAGVGRTGVFIALDIALEQAKEEGRVDVIGTINNMRFQRMKMVQTLAQYVFIHDAILESLVCGQTLIAITDFRLIINKLSRVDKDTEITGLESQYQVLKKITPQPFEVERKTALKYLQLNRSMDYLPREQRRVVLARTKDGHNYIHASFVDGYQQKKAFIITQGPLENTCDHFWQMIQEYKCATIVMLSDIMEYKQEVCYQYWPREGEVTHGIYSIRLSNESKAKDIITRKLILTNNESMEEREVTQYQFLHWTPDGLCADYSSVAELMQNVLTVQIQTGNNPIVVHCSDTVSRSGIFCAAMTAIECVKVATTVNIYQIVKSLRTQKPGAIPTVEQYSAIFSIVLAFIDAFAGYGNFGKR